MTPGSVAMLLAETTGLRVQTTAPSLGAANVRVNGLRGRYTQLLADGLPLYGSQGDSLSLLQVPPLDLGRVEIIKGAASALYGPTALGGVVNLVTRRPAANPADMLFNVTSQQGVDATAFSRAASGAAGGGRCLGGTTAQRAQRSGRRRLERRARLLSRGRASPRVLRQRPRGHRVCDGRRKRGEPPGRDARGGDGT